MELTEAYRECERITWTQARNFAYGIRLLPAAKRRGLAVIYAFARRIDDIGDGTLPADQKIAALEEARRTILDLNSADPADPVLVALADTGRNFPVPMEAFGELIDGCVADVRGTHYETFEDLLHYCRCVAGSIGRLSLGIFGTSHDPEEAARLADSLGVALQLTNILRDIREDHENGRVYLPAEDLAKFDCNLDDPDATQFPDPAGRVRSRTGQGLVRHRAAAAADAGPSQRGLYRRHGGHLPAVARADRGATRRGAAWPDVTVGGGEGCGRGQGPGPEDPMKTTLLASGGRSPQTPRRVAVIGGGLAGITAAITLAESGADVTLLEARPRLGGATCSFNRDGLVVDTGQHVFLGCCSAYRGLLARLGMTEHAPLQDRFDVTVLAPGGTVPRQARLRRTALPGPLHMLPALGRYPFLSLSERMSVARPALSMRRVDPADPVADTQRFGDWLAARGQSVRTRRALWDLFSVSSLNIAGDDASLALAATVVKTGLLGKNNAADIGVPALPLGELHGDAAATLLAKLGAQVALGTKVSAIEVTEGADARFLVRLGRGRRRPGRRRRGLGRPAREGRAADPAGRAAGGDGRGLGRPGRVAHRQRARDL